jgi:hypothetical protein
LIKAVLDTAKQHSPEVKMMGKDLFKDLVQ